MNLANTPGFWNNWRTERFSVKDYLQRLLAMEFNGLPGSYSGDLLELGARNFYEWCNGHCNPTSSFDLLHFIAVRRLNTPSAGRDLNPDTIAEDANLYPADFASAIISPKQEWKTGCKGGVVICNWGNTSMIDYYISTGETDPGAWDRFNKMSAAYVPHSVYTIGIYLSYDNWFALTANQANNLYPPK